jgi:hypothetical protein
LQIPGKKKERKREIEVKRRVKQRQKEREEKVPATFSNLSLIQNKFRSLQIV